MFEPIFISLIAAGEETGNLTHSFEQLIKHLKWTDAMNSKVKKATRYPKILIVVVAGVIWLMMTYVVPNVVGFLKDMGQTLPFVTTSLIATSEFFQNYFLYIVGTFIAIYIFIKVARGLSEPFRYYTDYITLHMPAIGLTIRKIALSRFCQTFAVLFTSGLEILKCLEAAQQTAVNLVITAALEQVRTQGAGGQPHLGGARQFRRIPVARRAHGEDRRGVGQPHGRSSSR